MAMVFYRNWNNARRELAIVKKLDPRAEIIQWGNDLIVKYDESLSQNNGSAKGME